MCGPDFCSMRLYSKTEGIKTFNEEKKGIVVDHRLLKKKFDKKYLADEKMF
jgi:hypothetical protein